MKLTPYNLFLFADTISKPKASWPAKPTTLNEQPVSLIVQFVLYTIFIIILVGLFFYFSDKLLKHWEFLKKTRASLKKNYFGILILFPFFYLVYYYAFYLVYKDENKSWFLLQEETAQFLSTAALTFFATGVATGALKWINNLAFFKKQFSELIQSEDFSNVLSEKMKELALSDDYLLQRNDLEEIWKRVTLCKYEQKFPEIAPEIQKKIENDLFLEQSLSYYYKNFRMQINLSLEGDIVTTTEITSFTVISHTTDEIEINFGCNSPVDDSETIYAKLIPDKCKCDDKIIVLKTENKEEEKDDYDPRNTNFKAILKGKKKYIIERQIEMTQDIKDDRVFSFSSSRIIEDLSLNIKLDENLNIHFSPVGKNVFSHDNHLTGINSISYINRDLLLPGEKFKVFIFKKN